MAVSRHSWDGDFRTRSVADDRRRYLAVGDGIRPSDLSSREIETVRGVVAVKEPASVDRCRVQRSAVDIRETLRFTSAHADRVEVRNAGHVAAEPDRAIVW